jgi:hypothetical protein
MVRYFYFKIITVEMENKLWDMGILGESDPPTLLSTIVYLFGLHFALRGRDEHRRLRRSQLTIRTGQDGRRYLEYQEVSMPIANVHFYLPRIGEDIA